MSTKATIAHGENFRFYHEVMDEDHVYLETETTHFEAGYGRVMLPIDTSGRRSDIWAERALIWSIAPMKHYWLWLRQP